MDVHIIIVAYDSGEHERRMGRGPLKLLAAGLDKELERLGATVSCNTLFPSEGPSADIRVAFALQDAVALAVAYARRKGAFPLVLAGNCNSAAVGMVAGIRSTSGNVPAVCWLDAHADFNTPETTVSGFLDGMAVSMLTGHCWKSMTQTVMDFQPVPESRVVMVGTRSYDPEEAELLARSAIKRVGAKDVVTLLDAALDEAHSEADEMYLHLDLDVVDFSDGIANSYACTGGLMRAEVLDVVDRVANRFRIAGAAITAYDPEHGQDPRVEQLAIDVAKRVVALSA